MTTKKFYTYQRVRWYQAEGGLTGTYEGLVLLQHRNGGIRLLALTCNSHELHIPIVWHYSNRFEAARANIHALPQPKESMP